MTIATYEITPELAQELRAAVAWWQAHGRSELTAPLALREAIEDWIAALRAEHLGDGDIPRQPPASLQAVDS
jgi:hypothetical protein